MKVWTVKFKGYNTPDYYETVSGRDKDEALQYANRPTIKRDSRDKVEWIKEDTTWTGRGGK